MKFGFDVNGMDKVGEMSFYILFRKIGYDVGY